MKVAAYLRVSTDRQAERGLSLDEQEDVIRRWARAGRHRIVSWHRDEGVSGANGLGSREGLADALETIRDRQAAGLVVYRLDRLARDLIVQETVLAEVWRLGGQVFSTFPSEAGYLSDDPDDPSRKLIRQVLGAVAEYEKSMVALRLRMGRRRKAAKGGYAHGAPPYGWRAEHRELVPVEEEQEVVTQISKWRAELDDNGNPTSLAEIARRLNDAGIPPRHSQPLGGRKEPPRWHPAQVARVLARSST